MLLMQIDRSGPPTGTPLYMALPVIKGGAHGQSTGSDLESLFYCFLDVATCGDLHWKHAHLDEVPAFDMKALVMIDPGLFSEKVCGRILPSKAGSINLRAVAKRLRTLFYPEFYKPPDVTVAQFQACLQE